MDVCVSVCGDVPLVGACIHSLGVCVCVCVCVRERKREGEEVNSSSPLCEGLVLEPSAQLLIGVCLQADSQR